MATINGDKVGQLGYARAGLFVSKLGDPAMSKDVLLTPSPVGDFPADPLNVLNRQAKPVAHSPELSGSGRREPPICSLHGQCTSPHSCKRLRYRILVTFGFPEL